MGEKLNFTKYGFVRVPDEDFSDDGSHFTTYKYKGIRVTYLKTKDDEVYLCARLSELVPCARALGMFVKEVAEKVKSLSIIEDKYNGVYHFTNDKLESYVKELDEALETLDALEEDLKRYKVDKYINLYTFDEVVMARTYETYEPCVVSIPSDLIILEKTLRVEKDNYIYECLERLKEKGFKVQENILKVERTIPF